MKRCPQCGRGYVDESLSYCLDDGSRLLHGPWTAEPRTEVLPGESPTREQIENGPPLTNPPEREPVSAATPQTTTKRLIIPVAIAALLLAAGAIFYRYWQSGESGTPIDSIAVLPFQNRNADSDTEYLSNGLAESLIYRLSQMPDLKVSPTSTVLRYQGAEIDPVTVGKELGVSAVLSGRIVQHGDSITISADLVDVANNRLLWGEQYDRKMSALLDTQRQIAKEIVEKLKLKVSPNETGLAKHYTENNEAYQAYLKGRYYWNKRTNESMHKSIDYYKQAIAVDPTFALAYSGLADSYNLICAPEAGAGDEAPNEMLPQAKAAALKALELDSTLAEAHISITHSLYFYDRDWAAAEREFKTAIELNPRYSTAHHWYAVYLTVVGRQPEALAEIKLAQELDPLSLSINVWVGWVLAFNGQTDAAIEQLLRTKEMDPNFLLTRHRLAMLYAEGKRFDDAIGEARELSRLSGGRLGTFTLAYVYAAAGRRKEALEQLDKWTKSSAGRFVAPASIAMVYAVLGDKDVAFRWLERANAEHDLLAVRLKNDPRFAVLRGDPRFVDLVKRMGMPQ